MMQTTYDLWLTTDITDSHREPITQDVYNNDIYDDTLIYGTEIGIVKADYMTKFFEDRNEHNGENGTFKFFDGTFEDIEEIADVILYDGYWFTAGETNEFLEFYEWNAVTYNDL